MLEKGEAILDEKKESGLYNLMSFVQNLSKKMGTILSFGERGSSFLQKILSQRYARDDMPVGSVSNGETFSPIVTVNISHNGNMTDADAKRYGRLVADSALQNLGDAFSKRGISSLGSATLK